MLIFLGIGEPFPSQVRSRPDLAFVLYNGQYLQIILPVVMVGCAVLMGIGGLGHERSGGTALFTLSLPATRRSIVLGRFLAGAAAIGVLCIGAEVGVALRAAEMGLGGQFPLGRALALGCCLGTGALSVYSFSFLTANVTAHTVRTVATVVTLLLILGYGAGARNGVHELHSLRWWLQPLNYLSLMGGGGFLPSGRFPWIGVAIALGITAALLEVTTRWVERFDF